MYIMFLPKDSYLGQRVNLPKLLNLLFAQKKSTWLEVCKKQNKTDHFDNGSRTEKGFVKALENLTTLELTLPANF